MFKWMRYGALTALAAAALAACGSTPSSAPAPSTSAPTSMAAPAQCRVHASNAIIDAMDTGAVCYTVPQAVKQDTQHQYWVSTGYQVSPTSEEHESGRMYVPITRTSTTQFSVQLNERDRSDYAPDADPAYYQRGGWVKAVVSYK